MKDRKELGQGDWEEREMYILLKWDVQGGGRCKRTNCWELPSHGMFMHIDKDNQKED